MPDEPDPSQPGWAAPTPPPSPDAPDAPRAPTPPPSPEAPDASAAPTRPAPPEWSAQPPPSGWGAPPPPDQAGRARRRRRWPWVLGAVLGAIVILAISGTVLFVQKVKPPIDAANEFLDEVEAGNLDAAIELLCTEDRENIDQDDLFLGALAALDDFEANPFDVDIDGDRATVAFDADGLGDDQVIELPLRKENGDWRPCLSDIELR